MNVSSTIFLITAIATSATAGRLLRRKDTTEKTSFPVVTVSMAILVVSGLCLQILRPELLPLFERQGSVFSNRQFWRLVTPLFFQDGGVFGGGFNLVVLALVGSVAERIWGRMRWLVIYLGGGILTEVLSAAWQPKGAGNSVGNLALSGSVFIFCLLSSNDKLVRVLSVVGIMAGIGLLASKDIHGIATILGVLVGAALYTSRMLLSRVQRFKPIDPKTE